MSHRTIKRRDRLLANVLRYRARQCRSGTTTVESALILGTLLLLLFATLDLGLASLRYNLLAGVARRVARQAIVRGATSTPEHAAWGPGTYSGTAADASDISETALPLLATMKPSEVALEVTWPDGTNQEHDRVRVRLRYLHQPLIPLVTLGTPLDLQAGCDMRIVH